MCPVGTSRALTWTSPTYIRLLIILLAGESLLIIIPKIRENTEKKTKKQPLLISTLSVEINGDQIPGKGLSLTQNVCVHINS